MRFPAGGAWQGILASLFLHLAAAAVLLFAMPPASPPGLPVIDLSLLPSSGSGKAGNATRTANTLRPATKAVPAAEPPPMEPFPAAHSPAAPAPAAASKASAAAASAPVSSPSETPTDPSSGTGSRPGGGYGLLSAPPSPPAGVVSTLPGYEYLREAIQREASYPPVARRMGWEGRVVVAFMILSDGAVRDVRVVRGSGHAVLDRNAVEAVRSASPFPHPPAEAEVVTPVVYRLE